jgi:hypothetical protein
MYDSDDILLGLNKENLKRSVSARTAVINESSAEEDEDYYKDVY